MSRPNRHIVPDYGRVLSEVYADQKLHAAKEGNVRLSALPKSRLLVAALAGWGGLVAMELILLFGVLRLFAFAMGPELLPSLKVVLDMLAFAAGGWIAGRMGRPFAAAAAVFTSAGLALFDLTPYIPVNVPWLLRLAVNAFSDTRYVSSLFETLTLHALMFGSLFVGARLSRPSEAPMRLGFDE